MSSWLNEQEEIMGCTCIPERAMEVAGVLLHKNMAPQREDGIDKPATQVRGWFDNDEEFKGQLERVAGLGSFVPSSLLSAQSSVLLRRQRQNRLCHGKQEDGKYGLWWWALGSLVGEDLILCCI